MRKVGTEVPVRSVRKIREENETGENHRIDYINCGRRLVKVFTRTKDTVCIKIITSILLVLLVKELKKRSTFCSLIVNFTSKPDLFYRIWTKRDEDGRFMLIFGIFFEFSVCFLVILSTILLPLDQTLRS